MKWPKKKIVKPRNPVAIAAKLRTSAGPMKAGKKRLHKKLREENRRRIYEESKDGK